MPRGRRENKEVKRVANAFSISAVYSRKLLKDPQKLTTDQVIIALLADVENEVDFVLISARITRAVLDSLEV